MSRSTPGAPLDCANPDQAPITKVDGTATVFTVQPVVGKVWNPSPALTQTKPAHMRLYLTPGHWDLSIQYASTQPLHVTANGPGLASPFSAELRTNLLFRGPSPYYPVGSLEVRKAGIVIFDVDVGDPPLIGRLLRTESKAYLSGLAATRSDPARETIPLRQACGRYVDWYAVAPGTPRERPARSRAPQPQPIARQPISERPEIANARRIGPCRASGSPCLVILVLCLLASMVIAIVKLS